MDTFWYRLTKVHLEKWPSKWRVGIMSFRAGDKHTVTQTNKNALFNTAFVR